MSATAGDDEIIADLRDWNILVDIEETYGDPSRKEGAKAKEILYEFERILREAGMTRLQPFHLKNNPDVCKKISTILGNTRAVTKTELANKQLAAELSEACVFLLMHLYTDEHLQGKKIQVNVSVDITLKRTILNNIKRKRFPDGR